MASSTSAAAAAASVAAPVLKEGKASILNEKGLVFYNPAQVQNRDLSVAAIRVFTNIWEEERKVFAEKKKAKEAEIEAKRAKKAEDEGNNWEGHAHRQRGKTGEEEAYGRDGIRVLEAFSATGLRSMRYAMEIPKLTNILANDIDPKAVAAIAGNREMNGINEALLTPNLGDACDVLYAHRHGDNRFEIVDLDPYGSAAPFLDGAVQAVAEGGLLCVTCTDMAVLCGNHTEACYAKYGSVALKGKHCHEFGLRIVLSFIEAQANKYKRYVVPLLCVSMDFYVRLFLRVYTSPEKVKRSMTKNSYVHQCVHCQTFHLQPAGKVIERGSSIKFQPGNGPTIGLSCDECESRFMTGGPIWNQALHDVEFVKKVRDELIAGADVFAASKRAAGLMSVVIDELPDQPLLYDVSFLSNVLKVPCPTLTSFKSALVHAGYKQSGAHTNPNGVKTNAPPSVVWDIMRCWLKQNPHKESRNTAISTKEPKITANFEHHADVGFKSKGDVRFVPAPEAEWGPMQRAKMGKSDLTVKDAMKKRRIENQGKNFEKKKQREAMDEGENEGENDNDNDNSNQEGKDKVMADNPEV